MFDERFATKSRAVFGGQTDRWCSDARSNIRRIRRVRSRHFLRQLSHIFNIIALRCFAAAPTSTLPPWNTSSLNTFAHQREAQRAQRVKPRRETVMRRDISAAGVNETRKASLPLVRKREGKRLTKTGLKWESGKVGNRSAPCGAHR